MPRFIRTMRHHIGVRLWHPGPRLLSACETGTPRPAPEKEEPYNSMVVSEARRSGGAHGSQDAYPAFNLSTISVAAAGQAFVNPKKGPKSREAAKPGE